MEIKQRYDPRRWTTTQVIAEQNPKKSNLRTRVHISWLLMRAQPKLREGNKRLDEINYLSKYHSTVFLKN